ncbi:hypothetical protein CUD01_09760 [Cellulomonas uda]|uniref:Uncharacterized protein n=1 Tax=Cellulomonas uda TaxID=1714 RepID=A0A4Y3K986_CELUD|nr:hypothetical protein CUD01_09760 [Cellulomonas uda]
MVEVEHRDEAARVVGRGLGERVRLDRDVHTRVVVTKYARAGSAAVSDALHHSDASVTAATTTPATARRRPVRRATSAAAASSSGHTT